ncbi:MAG: hypothetical protein WBD20_21400 [Pirellulaceae bacterium]
MSNKKLIVLSLDCLTPAALGCYGSSFNATPTIDALAANGCVWDRLVTSSADPAAILKQWLGSGDWMKAWKQHGSVELLSDSQAAISLATKSDFDQLYQIDPVGEARPCQPAANLESTQFAQLIAAAVERIGEDDDWSVLWLHSDFLQQCWDAPRWLVEPDSMEEFEDEPMDEAETLEAEMHQARVRDAEEKQAFSFEPLPCVFADVQPPRLKLQDDSHPDLIATWMQTYACQIRLIDELLGVLINAAGGQAPTIVVVGTSGISLGQNGWIGRHAGPLRSSHINVPLIINHGGPLRVPGLDDERQVIAALNRLGQSGVDDTELVSPALWGSTVDDDFQPAIKSRCGDGQSAITTPRWFFVEEDSDSHRLYLKPDDVHDFNDVSRLRIEVVDRFLEMNNNEIVKDATAQ